ncbi:hypothetical protein L1987_33138 [Smallanthus sonchifolius]|uniref:Uncharacterized protein n=1 Tax=Smallanthus sonchifolius TaxID=185202 RepID=A0ACB9HPP8_9ASTR|nr:hypothetical protein L1987_33138 [Smallanthus sonchifolius]
MINAFISDHRDSNLRESDVSESAPELGELSDWALNIEDPPDWLEEFKKKLVGSPLLRADIDDCSLSEILAQLGLIICDTPMEECVEGPEDPGEVLEFTPLEPPLLEPSPAISVHVEGSIPELSPSFRSPKSRSPRKRTRALRDVCELERVQTPSAGKSKGDELLGYLNRLTCNI